MNKSLLRFLSLTPRTLMAATLVFAVALIAASFYIEYGLGAKPCPMCWWQRYTHWMIAGLALLGLVSGGRPGYFVWLGAAAVTAVVSGGIGLYQGLGQLGLVALPASCTGGADALAHLPADPQALMAALESAVRTPSCADVDVAFFGLSLAWWNFVIMVMFVTVLVVWWRAGKWRKDEK